MYDIGLPHRLLQMVFGDSAVCWKEDSSFQQICQFVSELEIIYNAAERSVHSDSDYNEISTSTTKHTLSYTTITQDFYWHNKPFRKISDFFVFN